MTHHLDIFMSGKNLGLNRKKWLICYSASQANQTESSISSVVFHGGQSVT